MRGRAPCFAGSLALEISLAVVANPHEENNTSATHVCGSNQETQDRSMCHRSHWRSIVSYCGLYLKQSCQKGWTPLFLLRSRPAVLSLLLLATYPQLLFVAVPTQARHVTCGVLCFPQSKNSCLSGTFFHSSSPTVGTSI